MELIIGAIMVIIGFVVGGARERKHLEDIKKRESDRELKRATMHRFKGK